MKMRRSPLSLGSYSTFIVSLIGLAAVLTQMNTIQNWFSQASGEPANIIIDTKGVLGELPRPWQYLAQGGESPDYRFSPALSELKALEPRYIRLDHIYDFYQVVSRDSSGRLTFNWQQLDLMLTDITAVGATPFISLSYMPPALNQGDLTGVPNEWHEWSLVVQKTIEHISGINGLNLDEVYYEVWNEPDLFGQWKTYGSKNYLTLYEYAAKGADRAQSVKPFKFGGPATTKLYDNWVTRFVDYAVKNNLRFDFFSWHHYTTNVDEYRKDFDRYNQLMRRYPDLIFQVEPIISEWGFTPEVHPDYDTDLAAAHAVSVVSTVIPKLNKMFLFEFQDGKDPNGQEYWGKWGLVTHQDFGSHPKPRYKALELLNRLGDQRLSVIGNGYWVRSLASKKDDDSIQVIISNYDSANKRVETVPLTFLRVEPGVYQITTQFLGRPQLTQLAESDADTLTYSLNLYPNATVFLEIIKR
jgi:hypothetical protein